MRLAHVGIIVLMLSGSGGCLRFGYDGQTKPVVRDPDASWDAASPDAATTDAATTDAATTDAATTDAATTDAAAPPPTDAGAVPQDSGMDAAVGVEPADTGTVDPALSDAAVDVGGTDPCIDRTDLVFCGGFDDSAAWGPSRANNGTVITTTERARSGGSSLHASTSAASSGTKLARREAAVFDAQTSGEIWARAFFYLPSSTVIDAASLIGTMRLSEAEPPYGGCSVVIRPNYVELGGVTTRYRALSPFPRDRWTCVELSVVIDGSAGDCNAYVDGMQAAQVQDVDTLPAGGYTLLSVGVEYTNAAQGPVDLYIDDVAAANTRVGCD